MAHGESNRGGGADLLCYSSTAKARCHLEQVLDCGLAILRQQASSTFIGFKKIDKSLKEERVSALALRQERIAILQQFEKQLCC